MKNIKTKKPEAKIIGEYQQFAEKLVRDAGMILSKSKDKIEVVNYKDTQDILTNIDLEIEKSIISQIQKKYPRHSIFSEEAGEIKGNSGLTWVIDPLDGTKEYLRGIPLYCSAIILEKDGESIAAAIYDPELDELYSAGAGLGAYLNGEKIQVSKQTDLNKSFLFTYLPRDSKGMLKLAPLFDLAYRIRGHANHNMSYCWVAKGGYEAHFSLFTPQHWWDIAPGILILKEAGGEVTDLEGNEVNHGNHSTNIIGSNGKIHKQLMESIKKLI